MLVLDPLARQNACACVGGYAQRDYGALAEHLSKRIGRQVKASYAGTGAAIGKEGGPEIVVGKHSVVMAASKSHGPYLCLAMLTGLDGKTTQQGLLVVRKDDPARRRADLKGRRVLLGEADAEEKHSTILALLRQSGIAKPRTATRPTCSIAALAVVEKQADAAAISGYAMPLLEGCGTVKKGALRVVGKAAPVPFIGVFARADLPTTTCAAVAEALKGVARDPALKRVLETRDGLVGPTVAATIRMPLPSPLAGGGKGEGARRKAPRSADWTDWRGGPARTGLVADLPASLPESLPVVWRRPMESSGVGGVSVAGGRVYCSGKTADGISDLWVCLDAATGREVWRLTYPAPGKMDYTNTPRASPVIVGGRAYLLGAFGHLHAVNAATGAVIWQCDLPRRFGGTVPTWGLCAAPLVLGGKVIVPTGSPGAALVALDAAHGSPVWISPGKAPGYGNFVTAVLGGVRQVIWHDKDTLGGWDPETGRRLWTLKPPQSNDFNVPTPVALGDRLLVATENNGTRLYGFGGGRVVAAPIAESCETRPNTASPVVVDGVAWVASEFGLFALDARAGLRTIWKNEEAPVLQHASLIGAPGRVLIVTLDGHVSIFPSRPTADMKPSLQPLPVKASGDDDEVAVWSHPAVVGNRLYVRTNRELICLALD
ncbi:MAG: hypothetical protein FJX72_00850 [Armatimonadetes bacterium]|nr:hypothetical protein [Armatimonadota bacterium]